MRRKTMDYDIIGTTTSWAAPEPVDLNIFEKLLAGQGVLS